MSKHTPKKKKAAAKKADEKKVSGKITPAKARQILKDGKFKGKALTTKQKKFFKMMAGRK